MSPEQLRGEVVDSRTDLYSLGVTLYKMATGRLPTPLTDVRDGLPARFAEVISKALEEHPVARFQTADEFHAALESVRSNPGPTRPLRRPDRVDPAALSKVEKCLSAVLGPIAHQVLSRLARRGSSLDALCEEAAREIPDAADREAFFRCCVAHAGRVAGLATRSEIRTSSHTNVGPNWDPALLERTRKELARFIGPMARVLVEKASKRASTPQQLWDALAATIPDKADQERFQKAVGKM
jgi:serine/threonine-protein kinase